MIKDAQEEIDALIREREELGSEDNFYDMRKLQRNSEQQKAVEKWNVLSHKNKVLFLEWYVKNHTEETDQ